MSSHDLWEFWGSLRTIMEYSDPKNVNVIEKNIVFERRFWIRIPIPHNLTGNPLAVSHGAGMNPASAAVGCGGGGEIGAGGGSQRIQIGVLRVERKQLFRGRRLLEMRVRHEHHNTSRNWVWKIHDPSETIDLVSFKAPRGGSGRYLAGQRGGNPKTKKGCFQPMGGGPRAPWGPAEDGNYFRKFHIFGSNWECCSQRNRLWSVHPPTWLDELEVADDEVDGAGMRSRLQIRKGGEDFVRCADLKHKEKYTNLT